MRERPLRTAALVFCSPSFVPSLAAFMSLCICRRREHVRGRASTKSTCCFYFKRILSRIKTSPRVGSVIRESSLAVRARACACACDCVRLCMRVRVHACACVHAWPGPCFVCLIEKKEKRTGLAAPPPPATCKADPIAPGTTHSPTGIGGTESRRGPRSQHTQDTAHGCLLSSPGGRAIGSGVHTGCVSGHSGRTAHGKPEPHFPPERRVEVPVP